MSQNKVTIDVLKKRINTLSLSSKLSQQQFGGLFYEHLTGMMKHILLNPALKHDDFKLNEKKYHVIEQYIFENSKIVEHSVPQEIDWDLIDDAKDILRTRIKGILKKEADSNHLKPIIKFTVDSYENWLIYYHLHPYSVSNPWVPTNGIMENGYIYIASDDRDLLDHYQKKVYQKADSTTRGNIGIIAKSAKENEFSGFLVDNRHNTQMLVFEFLKREAKGMSYAKDFEKIRKFLATQDIKMDVQAIRSKITIPLKRAGLIGSSTNGFFYIDTIEDLILSYRHHKEKSLGIQRTLNLYIEKGKKLGIDDLDQKAGYGKGGILGGLDL